MACYLRNNQVMCGHLVHLLSVTRWCADGSNKWVGIFSQGSYGHDIFVLGSESLIPGAADPCQHASLYHTFPPERSAEPRRYPESLSLVGSEALK